MKKNIKIILSYDGTRFFGWEHQKNKALTIQGKLENVLYRMLIKEEYKDEPFTQLCQTFCNPLDCGPPGSSVHGILGGKILEWVAISSSRVIFPDLQGSPALQVDSLTSEPLGKPKNGI